MNNIRIRPYGLPPTAAEIQREYDLQEVRVIRRQEPLRPELPVSLRSPVWGGPQSALDANARERRYYRLETHISEPVTPRQRRSPLRNQFVPRAQRSA